MTHLCLEFITQSDDTVSTPAGPVVGPTYYCCLRTDAVLHSLHWNADLAGKYCTALEYSNQLLANRRQLINLAFIDV